MHNPIEQTNGPAQACAERLRALPPQMLPPYNWQEFQRRAQRGLPTQSIPLDWRHMAAAAALLLIVCGTAVWGRWGRGTYDTVLDDSLPPYAATHEAPSQRQSASSVASFDSIAALRSRAIESWLATLPREPVVVHVGTRAAVTQLEDRIAQVDDLLTSVRLDGMRPDSLAALQQERVRLVGSLAQVRYAEVVAAQLP
jgi:hypothetical protein